MSLDKQWKEFIESSVESKKDSFIEYCSKNIKASDSGDLTVREASYNICAACMNIKDNIAD